MALFCQCSIKFQISGTSSFKQLVKWQDCFWGEMAGLLPSRWGDVSAGLRPNALDYQDAYAAAWRDALVKELRAYKATADHCFSVVLDSRRDEAHFIRMMKGAKTHHKACAHRAWRRNAKRMARKWARSL
jgi:hypothetical protein